MTDLPLLLSYRKAAKLLGVGRNASLHALIAAGLLVPVKLPTGADGSLRWFIPRQQIEALAEAGAATPKLPPAPRTTKRKGGSIGDIEIPGLPAPRKRKPADIIKR